MTFFVQQQPLWKARAASKRTHSDVSARMRLDEHVRRLGAIVAIDRSQVADGLAAGLGLGFFFLDAGGGASAPAGSFFSPSSMACKAHRFRMRPPDMADTGPAMLLTIWPMAEAQNAVLQAAFCSALLGE